MAWFSSYRVLVASGLSSELSRFLFLPSQLLKHKERIMTFKELIAHRKTVSDQVSLVFIMDHFSLRGDS